MTASYRLNKKAEPDIADRFEAALDFVPALDRVPFHIKREAAIKAARLALEFMLQEAAP